MADINFISGFSMLAYLIGLTLYLFGIQITRIVGFPLFFMIFMLPIPNGFIDLLGVPTKAGAVTIGMIISEYFGIPVYREGFLFFLPESTLFVGTPCNGMKSLISFAALGLISLYLSRSSLIKCLGIIILLYPLALILNGLRVAALVLIAYNYGIDMARENNIIHNITGLITFAIGMLSILMIIKIERFMPSVILRKKHTDDIH